MRNAAVDKKLNTADEKAVNADNESKKQNTIDNETVNADKKPKKPNNILDKARRLDLRKINS